MSKSLRNYDKEYKYIHNLSGYLPKGVLSRADQMLKNINEENKDLKIYLKRKEDLLFFVIKLSKYPDIKVTVLMPFYKITDCRNLDMNIYHLLNKHNLELCRKKLNILLDIYQKEIEIKHLELLAKRYDSAISFNMEACYEDN